MMGMGRVLMLRSECRFVIVIGILGWAICITVHRVDEGVAVRTCCNSTCVVGGRSKAMKWRMNDTGEAGFVALSDKGEAPYGIGDDASKPGCGLFREGCKCGCWPGACEFWMLFHRSANVF